MSNLTEDEIERMIVERVRDERERCALLCEMLASIHEASAARIRKEKTFTTRAIWPPFKLMTFVAPGAERDARVLERAAHGHRVVANCIRRGYDPREIKPCSTCDGSCDGSAACTRRR